ncbi:MAG: flagellar biosynthetic protein FliR, partial [Lachnospiraceae bacterium]|nr:flagellar biosynthetic protein FliR [Lachnospiraceae bacterium]
GTYMAEYFVLAFRIILPIFAAMLIVNTVLAILAKVAPQMSLFVIGIQLKVLVGLAVMIFMIQMLPGIGELIFGRMMEIMRDAISYF